MRKREPQERDRRASSPVGSTDGRYLNQSEDYLLPKLGDDPCFRGIGDISGEHHPVFPGLYYPA